MYGEIIGANRVVNVDKLCTPVTDEVKINEQNKSIVTGALYTYTPK